MWKLLFSWRYCTCALFGIDDALVGAIGGSLISGLFGSSGQKSANETNIKLGREQMAFQERMSNTSYQRGVKDMQAAGLNPMLAYSQGGANAPMGSMPRVENVAGAGVSSATQGASIVSALTQALQSSAQTDVLKATAEKIRQETLSNEAHSAEQQARIRELRARGLRTEEEVPGVRGDSALKQLQSQVELHPGKGFEGTSFDADRRRRQHEAKLRELDIPRAVADEKFYEGLGKANPYLKMFIDLLRVSQGIGRISGR